MASQVEIWQKWERENGEKYKGERVLIRGIGHSVHRFNPSVVAISVIVTEEIKQRNTCRVHRVTTFLHTTNSDFPVFYTRCETTVINKGKYYETKPGTGEFWCYYNELPKALEQHAQMVSNIQAYLKNPAWRVSSVKEYVKGSEWDANAARKYNHAYGLPTPWQFSELAVGDLCSLTPRDKLDTYKKVSDTEIEWQGRAGAITPCSADYIVWK